MGRLDGKIALITGGARGQGEAESRLFSAEGATVVLTDILDDLGKAVAKDIGGSYHHHDVTDAGAWKQVVDAVMADHGRIDVLVNNAGIFKSGSFETTTLEDYRRVIEVNQIGVFLGIKTVAPHMREAGRGSIINISSVAGLRGTGGAVAYGASKWAVRGMTKSAAQELTPYGVRVNSIHPGLIETPMLHELPGVDSGNLGRYLERVPIGRVADAADVARTALFLASDDSAYCSGGEYLVDGAMTA